MNPLFQQLQIGSKIKFLAPPSLEKDPELLEIFERIVARKLSIRISSFSLGLPSFNCKFKENGTWTYHHIMISPDDDNYIIV
jgi:hypothetical protein